MKIESITEKKVMKKLLTFLLAFSSTVYATCDWPSVNHDLFNTRSNPCETTLNRSNVGSLVVVDQLVLNPVTVQAAPAIVNNVIYFGDSSGTVHSRDANNLATVFWTRNLGASVDAPVTVANNIVYVVTSDCKLHALDAITGNEIAGFPVIVDPNNVVGVDLLAGPVVVDNIVIVPTADGSPPPFGTDVTPSRHQSISAFNATTGAFIWRRVVQPAPFGAQGGSFSTAGIDTNLHLMFIGTSNSDDRPVSDQTDALLALDYRTGVEVWSYQFTANDAWGALYPCDPDADIGASPNLFTIKCKGKNIDVVGVASKKGDYKVFCRNNGNLIWENDTVPPGWNFISLSGPGGAYDATTGFVYVPVLIDNSGLPYQTLSILSLNGNAGASALLNGINFGSARTQITAINATTGKTVWVNSFPIVSSGSISAVNGVVYCTNWNGEVRALDGTTGTQLFLDNTTFGPFTFLGGATAITGGKLYVPVGINAVPTVGGVTVYGLP